jgi:putative ABC transport system permease protein
LSDPAFDAERAPSGWYREGVPEVASIAMKRGEGACVSVSLSDRFSLHTGDTIELTTPDGPLQLPIVGVVPDYISDRGSVIVNRRALVQHWHDDNANRFLVYLEPTVTPNDMRTALQTRLGARYRLKLLDQRQLLDYHTDLIDRAFAVMHSIQALIVIVTVAGIFDLLISRAVERRTELGLWRVIGASDRTIRSSIILEAATVGVFGSCLGIAAGFLSAWIWIRVHFRQLLGYYLDYHFAWALSFWYVALVVVMTCIAGSAAARYVVRRPVLETIRND